MEYSNNNKNKKIIIQTLKDCVEVIFVDKHSDLIGRYEKKSSNQNSNSFLTNLKAKIANIKDAVKYNLISFNTYFSYHSNQQITIFNKHYDTNNPFDLEAMNNKIKSIIYFSYKKNFPFIKNTKNGNLCSSDSGWGCMIRSCQMILSRAIYKILKCLSDKYKQFDTKEDIILETIYWFLEYPFPKESCPQSFQYYIAKGLEVHNKSNPNCFIKHVSSVYPAFGIKTICSIGEIFEKTAGEWFSDVNLPKIFDLINEGFCAFPDVKICSFITTIKSTEIIQRCFSTNSEDALFKNDESLTYNDKIYYLSKCGVVFVSTRIGLTEIADIYYPSIIKVFECKQCLGFVGGKNNSAHYFIGHDGENNLLFLDPHYALESINNNFNKTNLQNTFLNKEIYQLDISKLNCAFTVVFLFRTCKEFKDLQTWLRKYNKSTYPSFDYSEKSLNHNYLKQKEVKGFIKVEHNNSNDDDF